METKKENSKAAARDIPAICPAAIVAMERGSSGKHRRKESGKSPIQIACRGHIFHLPGANLAVAIRPAGFGLAGVASMLPHPDSADEQVDNRYEDASRCLPITFVSRFMTESLVTTKAASWFRLSGVVLSNVAVSGFFSPEGKGRPKKKKKTLFRFLIFFGGAQKGGGNFTNRGQGNPKESAGPKGAGF